MATLEFGAAAKTTDEYISEIQEIIGYAPASVVVSDGKLLQVSVETEWKEGATTPIEEEVEVETGALDEDGEPVKETVARVVDYEEDYTEKKLTKKQTDDLSAYIAQNIEP